MQQKRDIPAKWRRLIVPNSRLCSGLILVVLCLSLAACGAATTEIAPRLDEQPVFTFFGGADEALRELQEVTYVVHYSNRNSTESFSDTTITMSHDEDLILEASTPEYQLVEGTTTQERWVIGDIAPNDAGTIEIRFKVDNGIAPSACELSATLELEAYDSVGYRYTEKTALRIPIEGRPTCGDAFSVTLTAVFAITGTVDVSALKPPPTGLPFVLLSPSDTPSPSATATTIPTQTPTLTPIPTSTSTPSPTNTATLEPSPTSTNTPEPTSTATNTPEPSSTPTPTATSTSTLAPTRTVTPTPTLMSTSQGISALIPETPATVQVTVSSPGSSQKAEGITGVLGVLAAVLLLASAGVALYTEVVKSRNRSD